MDQIYWFYIVDWNVALLAIAVNASVQVMNPENLIQTELVAISDKLDLIRDLVSENLIRNGWNMNVK